MKLDKEKFKQFWESKYRKPILFFGFYLLFFIFVFMLTGTSLNNENKRNQVTDENIWDVITNNYEYQYEIKYADSTITFEGKKYNHKNLYTKRENESITEEGYIFYDEIKVKKDGKWIVENQSSTNVSTVDERFLEVDKVLDYIKEMTADAELMETRNNFDNTKSEIYSLADRTIEVISEENKLKKVIVNDPHMVVTLQYKNINEVNDFVVEN